MAAEEATTSVRWWGLARGDIDATVMMCGFNLAQVIIPAVLLVPMGIPLEFSLTHFVPGAALGMLVGSLGFIRLAINIRKRERRTDVTVHPYGPSVPAMLAYTLAIMLPAYLQTHNINRTWQIGAAAVVWTGLIKLAAAPFAGLIKRVTPTPAMMSVLAAALYSFLLMVLLQRIFDQPLLGIIALTIVAICVLGGVPITSWKIPPFLVAWLVPLAVGLSIGYVHPVWSGMSFELPFAWAPAPLRGLTLALPALSVIVPMSIYHILQDIASVEGASAAQDNYDARSVVAWDGVGTLVCGLAGSVIAPLVFAIHPALKGIGARTGYMLWSSISLLAVVMSGLLLFAFPLFPWPVLSAMMIYISIGVGRTTLQRVGRQYYSVVLLGFIIPVGAVVSLAVGSVLPALKIQITAPAVQAVLNHTIYWSSLQGLSNGFLLLVLVVSALITETINRNFGRAAIWCLCGSMFSWVGLMHSGTFRWGAEPTYAVGWLIAAVLAYSARWWRGESEMDAAAVQSKLPIQEPLTFQSENVVK